MIFSLIFITFWLIVAAAGQGCPPGLNPLFPNSNSNTPQTCTPQDPCSCTNSRIGSICQYSTSYNNYICCVSTNTQCGSNSSPQTNVNGLVVNCNSNQQCAANYVCNGGVCCPDTTKNTCSSSSGSGCLLGQVLVNGVCMTQIHIGSPCQSSAQCMGGSMCTQNYCQCPSGYVNVNQQCVISNGVNCPIGTVSYNMQCISLSSPGQTCQASSQCINYSVCNGGTCQCQSNYNLVYGYCVPYSGGPCQMSQTYINGQCVLYSVIGESCIASAQCVGGSFCNSGTCQCNQGTTALYGYCISNNGGNNAQCGTNQVAINNQCYNTVQTGGSCQFSQQCLFNGVCTNGICQATTPCTISCNTNQACVNNQCFNMVAPGFQCTYTQQCTGNSQCLNNICVCPAGTTLQNGLCTSNGNNNNQCGSNQILINNQCWNTVQIGGQCGYTQQCLGNSQCLNSFCQCLSGSNNNNGQCSGSNGQCAPNQVLINNQCFNTVSIGSQCSYTQQCLGNSQCLNNFCQCPSGSNNNNGQCSGSNGQCGINQVLINNQCYNTVSIGFQCSFSQQCLGNSQCLNNFCQCPSGSSNVNGQCSGSNNQCGPNQILINNQCFNTVSIGSQCSYTQQCLGNSQCLNNFCQCPSGSFNNNGQCSGSNGQCGQNQVLINNQCYNTAQIGSQCSYTQQCLSNSQCLNNFCQCPSGSSNVNGQCSGSNNQCGPNQVLINNQCFNTASIGSQCSYTQQCLGNSQCLNNFCQCPSGSNNNNGQCSGSNGQCSPNQILINNQCFNTVSIGSQCSYTQQCLGNSQCLNNFCQCPSGTSNVNGQCSSSNSNSNLCSAGQTVQLNSSGQPINCLISSCPANSICQFAASTQQYVCCTQTNGKKKK